MLVLPLALASLLAQNPAAGSRVKPPKVSNRVLVANGNVTEWTGGGPATTPVEKPLEGATVIVGQINVHTGPSGVDHISGKVVAKTSTNARGNWTVEVPAGKYTVVLWKAGYTPWTDPAVVIPSGTIKGSISVDKAGQGLHKSLVFK